MTDRYMQTVLTPSVLDAEREYYGKSYPTFDAQEPDSLRDQEIEMIQSRDSFYMATITEDDWPYLQHRGGPKGFLRVLNRQQIGFADYRGNRQLITVGALSKSDRVSLFLIDYPTRTRLKMLGHARVLKASDNPKLAEQLAPPEGHGSKPERLIVSEGLTYDWNCPTFITPRYTKSEIEEVTNPLNEQIAALKLKLASYESAT